MHYVRFFILLLACFFAAAIPSYAQEATEEASTSVAEESGLEAPIIFSKSYPDKDAWYQATTSLFSWFLPEQVDTIWFEFSESAPKEPERELAKLFDQVEFLAREIPEGVSYVNVQFEAGSDLSPVSSWRLQIDNTPPEPFTSEVEPLGDGQVKLIVQATDALSGFRAYEVLKGGEVIKIIEEKASITHLEAAPGDELLVRVYDKAGNMREATATVPGEKKEGTTGIALSDDAQTTTLQLLVGTLTAVTFALLLYALMLRQRYATREQQLIAHNREAKSQIRKIFIALRDEMHDQIRSITVRKKLTKREEEVVQSLANALQISETLIEKELTEKGE